MDFKADLIQSILPYFIGDSSTLIDLFANYEIRPIAAKTTQPQDNDILIRRFLAAKKIDGLSEKTINNYGYCLRIFAQNIKCIFKKTTTDDIRDYVSFLLSERKLKDSSLQTHLNTLRSIFSWLHAEGIIRKNPMLKIKVAHLDKTKSRHALSIEELERLRAVCVSSREKAILEFFASSGCRVSEVAAIELSSINFRERSVIVHGKGSKDRKVFFSVRAKLMIENYLGERPSGTALFTGCKASYKPLHTRAIQKIFHELGQRANLTNRIYPHLLRHTFATHALNSGMDITVIQRLLGHEEISTTQIYANISNENIQHEYNRLIA